MRPPLTRPPHINYQLIMPRENMQLFGYTLTPGMQKLILVLACILFITVYVGMREGDDIKQESDNNNNNTQTRHFTVIPITSDKHSNSPFVCLLLCLFLVFLSFFSSCF